MNIDNITIKGLEVKLFALIFSISFFLSFGPNSKMMLGVIIFFLLPMAYITNIVITKKDESSSVFGRITLYIMLILVLCRMTAFAYDFIYYSDWLISGSIEQSTKLGLAIGNIGIVILAIMTKPNFDKLKYHASWYTLLIVIIPLIFSVFILNYDIEAQPVNQLSFSSALYKISGIQFLVPLLLTIKIKSRFKTSFKSFILILFYMIMMGLVLSKYLISGISNHHEGTQYLIYTALPDFGHPFLTTLIYLSLAIRNFILIETAIISLDQITKMLLNQSTRTEKYYLEHKKRNIKRMLGIMYGMVVIGISLLSFQPNVGELLAARMISNISVILMTLLLIILANQLSKKLTTILCSMFLISSYVVFILNSLNIIEFN